MCEQLVGVVQNHTGAKPQVTEVGGSSYAVVVVGINSEGHAEGGTASHSDIIGASGCFCHSEEAVGLSAPVPVLDGLVLTHTHIFPVVGICLGGQGSVGTPIDDVAGHHGLHVVAIYIISCCIRSFVISNGHILISPDLEGFYLGL